MLVDKCSICSTTLKPLFTSWFCPQCENDVHSFTGETSWFCAGESWIRNHTHNGAFNGVGWTGETYVSTTKALGFWKTKVGDPLDGDRIVEINLPPGRHNTSDSFLGKKIVSLIHAVTGEELNL